MSAATSLVALAARSASLRISSATTPNRKPASPAPAASMAAFSASRLVCEASSSIRLTISEISSERSPRLLIFLEMTCTSPRIRCMPARLSRTAASPFWAACSVWRAAPREVALGDLHHGVEERLDVLLEVLALLLLVVALALRDDLRAQPHHRVVERGGQLPDLVAGPHLERLAQVAATDTLGHPHDL